MSKLFDQNVKEIITECIASEKFEVDDHLLNMQVTTLKYKEIISSNDLLMDITEIRFIFCYVKNSNKIKDVSLKIKKYVTDNFTEEEKDSVRYYFIIFVDNFMQKIKCEEELNADIFYELFDKKIFKKNIYNEIVFVPNQTQKTFNVSIDSRIKSIENKLQDKVDGYILTASLKDIIEMYNIMGDQLFDKNVRYEIADKMNLKKEIEATLSERPEEFWFLNNGISILVDDNQFTIDKNYTLTFNYSNKADISIINGAQTISIAARMYYSMGKKERENISNAKVLLRVSQLKCKEEDKKNISDRISIGLNRQKPITVNDIFYTFPFINEINDIFENNKNDKRTFEIIKRGSQVFGDGHYEIQEFSQIVMAFGAQCPCSARNSLFIETDSEDGDIKFKNKEVFRDEIEKGVKKLDEFYKYYSPVNFANKLSLLYRHYVNENKGKYSNEELSILKYSKWLFTAYTIWVLNGKRNDDFSKFDYSSVADKVVNECIQKYIKLYYRIGEHLKIPIETNTFKNDQNYLIVRDFDEDGDLLNQKKELDDLIKSIVS